MKIAVVYTATTPELIADVNRELQNALGADAEFASYQNPAILQEARDNGGATPHCARMLLDLYEKGVAEGADILFNVCSSVGEAAKLAKPLYILTGVPFVRIDEDMARAAVAAGSRIGVIGTLTTTMEPSKQLLRECAEAAGKKITLVDALAEGAFGLDQEQFKQKLIDTAKPVLDKIDVLVMAQGSMAYAEKDVAAALGIPVFSSIRFGVAAVAEAAKALGK